MDSSFTLLQISSSILLHFCCCVCIFSFNAAALLRIAFRIAHVLLCGSVIFDVAFVLNVYTLQWTICPLLVLCYNMSFTFYAELMLFQMFCESWHIQVYYCVYTVPCYLLHITYSYLLHDLLKVMVCFVVLLVTLSCVYQQFLWTNTQYRMITGNIYIILLEQNFSHALVLLSSVFYDGRQTDRRREE